MAVQGAQSYFTTQAARMDDPRFVARQFPIGSGAVESSCKGVVEARLKGAGMRWATAGSQAIASLRALHRSWRWAAFWQTQPHTQPVSAPHVASPPPSLPATPAASAFHRAPASPPVATARVRSSPSTPHTRPKPTTRQRPLIRPRSA